MRRGAPDGVMACAGAVPTLETLAAVSILRDHPPALHIRVVNAADLMTLQPNEVHPHGLPDSAFDALITTNTPVIFAYHGYLWTNHRLTCAAPTMAICKCAARMRRAAPRHRLT